VGIFIAAGVKTKYLFRNTAININPTRRNKSHIQLCHWPKRSR